MTEKDNLLAKAISDDSIQIDGNNKNYTVPRSWGVYEIRLNTNTKRFRYGNHPVRENELIREFESVKSIGLFFEREDAKNLADILNS